MTYMEGIKGYKRQQAIYPLPNLIPKIDKWPLNLSKRIVGVFKKKVQRLNIKAQLWKRTEDYEGELTLIFKVPLICAREAKEIPIQEVLEIKVSVEDATKPIL